MTVEEFIVKPIARFIVQILKPFVLKIVNDEVRIWGDRGRLQIAPTAKMVNTLFNTSSGKIEIGDYTFTGHNVSLITGAHDYQLLLEERMHNTPLSGRDIVIGKGVWICSNATILGPAKIGDHAVIAAGALVLPGSEIASGTIVAGIPAKPIKKIDVLSTME